MMPNNDLCPIILGQQDSDSKKFLTSVVAFKAFLYYKVSIDNYEDWKDLITGVSVGISSPIYTYNEGEEFNEYIEQITVWNATYENLDGYYGLINNEKKYLYSEIEKYIEAGYSYFFKMPHFSEDQVKNNYLKASIFYKVKDFTWEDLENSDEEFQKLNLTCNSNTLATYPVMQDTANVSRDIYPAGGFAYNNRLNIFNIKSQYPKPTQPISVVYNDTYNTKTRCIFFIWKDGSEHIVKCDWIKGGITSKWVYYGDTNVYKCRIIEHSILADSYSYIEVNMTLHPWLNGSYAFIEEENEYTATSDKDIYDPSVTTNLLHYENAIYASNASNPFYFGVQGQNLIGTGEIKTVSTSAKALSQGQYGQFPLYAFTADGIWALTVDDEGKYSTSNPLNRDVVENADSVCQIDDAVTYACSQGLKVLQGSDARSISQVMEGYNTDEQKYLKGIEHEELLVADTNTIINMAASCKILYDPAGGRLLHIYPEDAVTKGKHYIYDLNNDAWTTCVDDTSKAKAIVPGYPYSTIQVENKLYQYDNTEDNDTLKNGVLLTREMTFDNPFVMKILADLKMIYTKHNSATKCKIGVFVSNDRVNWTQLTSLRKHAYQWYRFRIQTTMTDLDALTAVTCLTDMRRSNKLR